MLKKKKYIVIFLIKEQKVYTQIKKKRFNPSKTEIRFNKDKTYPINISNYTFSKGLKLYFFIDTSIADNCQLSFVKNGKKSLITPEIIDLLISEKIIHQLTSNLTDTAIKMNLMMIIIGAIIGGLIGWIAGGFG